MEIRTNKNLLGLRKRVYTGSDKAPPSQNLRAEMWIPPAVATISSAKRAPIHVSGRRDAKRSGRSWLPTLAAVFIRAAVEAIEEQGADAP